MDSLINDILRRHRVIPADKQSKGTGEAVKTQHQQLQAKREKAAKETPFF